MKASRNFLSLHRARFTGFLLLGLLAGCDSFLGIDGFEVGCFEDDKRCVDNDTQVCNAFGTWVPSEKCVESTCVDGVCVGTCIAGAVGCDDKTPKSCNGAGIWDLGAACEYACFEGRCDCDPGQTRCIENTLGVCTQNRVWQDEECNQQTCNDAAQLAQCVGECAPGKRCLGNTPQVCDSMGQWKSDVTCGIGQQCKEGECVAVCTPNSKRCFQNKKQTCNENEQWQDDADALCIMSTCDPDTVECIGICTQGEKQCKNTKTPQTCDGSGQWQDDAACAIACVNGTCTACTPGELGCEDNMPLTCGMNGQWLAGTPCTDQTCVSGICQGECAPGTRCQGNTPQSCNDAGQWEGATPCALGQECKAGSCSCIPDDRRCFDNTPQLCNDFKEWENLSPACIGQTCDPEVAACVGVCGPQQRQCLDANTVQHCDEKGQWQTTATCTLGCVQLTGECASCSAGQIRCTGNTPQSCGTTGQWQDEPTCVGQTCVGGSCLGECVFGSGKCESNWPLTCDALGVWRSFGQACAQGESCYQGQCATSCTPGAKRCAGDYPQTCNGNGSWQSAGAPCDACTECDADTGTCDVAPTPLADCTEPLEMALGALHTCARLPNGKVKCWGYNSSGELGLGDRDSRGENSGEMGSNLPFVDLGLPTGVSVVALAASFFHTCARTSDGRIKCWGFNPWGELGLGDDDSRGDDLNDMGQNLPFVDLGLPAGVSVAEISAGLYHTCARTTDGRIKCWGNDDYGQLGLGTTYPRGAFPGQMGQNLPFVDLGLPAGVTVAEICAGVYHTCARTSDGRIKCWGNNALGQLGLGDTNNRGDGPNEMGANLSFVNLGSGVIATKLTAGSGNTCVRTSDGRVKCWGLNDEGQLGLGDTNRRGDGPNEMGQNLPFVDLGLAPGVTVVDISAAGLSTCGRTSDGRIKCWGLNNEGQLGLGDTNNRGDGPNEMGANLPFVALGLGTTAIALRTSGFHTCAILTGSSLKCWGRNDGGQLGLFDALSRGDQPNEMGDSLPIVDL